MAAIPEHRMARLMSTGQARLAAWKDQQSTWWQSQEGSTMSGTQDGKASKIRMIGLVEWSAGQLGKQRLQTARWTKGQKWQGEIGMYGVIEEKTPFILLSLKIGRTKAKNSLDCDGSSPNPLEWS